MKIIKTILIWYTFLLLIFVFSLTVKAQELSLSVIPPLVEVMIKPGKTITQNYQIVNGGNDGLYSVHIYPFLPNGQNGQIDINEKADIDNHPLYSGWFTLLQPTIKFGEKFNVPAGSTTTIAIKLNIPHEATQKDYYFVVIFQSENEIGLGQSVSQTQGRIGSNLLVSVSEDGEPFKVADIKEFTAPFIVDSLGKIDYSVVLKNVGRTFFKPTGVININNFLSKKETTLQIAPQNVLAFSERKISCLKEESLIDCQYDSPVLLGLYRAKLTFTLDGGDKVYEAEVKTIAFPFSLIAVILIIFIIYRIINKKLNIVRKQGSNIS